MAVKKTARLIDVANEVGISRAAVARVLLGTGAGKIRVSEAASERIRVAAKKLNYKPNIAAQQLKGKSNKTIAVIAIDNSPRVMVDRIYAMEKRAWEFGYDLLLCRTPFLEGNNLGEFIERLNNRYLDGLIVLDQISERQKIDQNNRIFSDFKTVYHGYAISDDGDYGVDPDVSTGTSIAVQHCIDQGRQRIALATFFNYQQRIASWKKTLQKSMLIPDVNLCYLHHSNAGNKHITEASHAKEVVNHCIFKSQADAIICENDYWAARILNECQSRGIRVPEDVALVGYNNLDFTEFTSPPLTTIDECNDTIGKALVDQLLSLVNNENPQQSKIISVEPKLVVRSST